MKVLMLNEIKNWGGAEVLTMDLAKALITEGIYRTIGCNKNSTLYEKASKRALEKNEWLLAGVFSNLIHPWKFHRFNSIESLL